MWVGSGQPAAGECVKERMMWREEGWVWPAAAPSAGPQFTSRLPAPHAGRLTLAQDTRGTDGCKKLMRIEHERRAKTPKSHCTYTKIRRIRRGTPAGTGEMVCCSVCASSVRRAQPDRRGGGEAQRSHHAGTTHRHALQTRQDTGLGVLSYDSTFFRRESPAATPPRPALGVLATFYRQQ